MDKIQVNIRAKSLVIRGSTIRLDDSFIDATKDPKALNLKYRANCSAEDSPIHEDVCKLEAELGENYVNNHIDISIPQDENAHYMHINGDFKAYITRK